MRSAQRKTGLIRRSLKRSIGRFTY